MGRRGELEWLTGQSRGGEALAEGHLSEELRISEEIRTNLNIMANEMRGVGVGSEEGEGVLIGQIMEDELIKMTLFGLRPGLPSYKNRWSRIWTHIQDGSKSQIC